MNDSSHQNKKKNPLIWYVLFFFLAFLLFFLNPREFQMKNLWGNLCGDMRAETFSVFFDEEQDPSSALPLDPVDLRFSKQDFMGIPTDADVFSIENSIRIVLKSGLSFSFYPLDKDPHVFRVIHHTQKSTLEFMIKNDTLQALFDLMNE